MRALLRGSLKFLCRIAVVLLIVAIAATLFFALRPEGTFTPAASASSQAIRSTPELAVLSWNIRRGENDDNSWTQRAESYASHLQGSEFDIVCLQEALPDQIALFAEILPGHDSHATGRDGKSDSTDEHCPIFYRRDRFSLKGKGTFWLSPTPDEPGKSWGEIYPRICTWVELEEKETQIPFRICNVHLHLNPFAQPKAASVIVEHLNPSEVPAVITGDFNAPQGWPALKPLYRNGFREADSSGALTYHVGGKGIRCLDHILISEDWNVNAGGILRAEKGEPEPSDHFGLWARLQGR